MIKLKETTHTGNGQPIVYVEGDTFPIYKKLGRSGLGFTWYGAKKIWWMYKQHLTQEKIAALSNLGVDISEFTGNNQQSNVTNIEQKPLEEKVKASERNLTNKTDVEPDAPSPKYYGFNVKKDIFSTELEFIIDDQKVPLTIKMNRLYKKGQRKIPIYTYSIYSNLGFIGKIAEKAPGEWGTYDEDDLVRQIQGKVQERINQKTELYRNFHTRIKLGNRDPEFVEFLRKWKEEKYGDNKEEIKKMVESLIPTRKISLTEPGYEGEYEIGVDLIENTIYLETKINDPQAPRKDILGTFAVYADISNLAGLNAEIDKFIQENNQEISNNYLKYLKSFPFKKEEKQQTTSQMKDIVEMIGNNFDVEFFKNKLISFGYVRPSKKVKNLGLGMVPQDQIKYVIDDKLIRDKVFSRNADNYPDYFYAVLAYYLMRKARRISSWSEALLVSNMGAWISLAKKYNHNITINDLDKYLETIVIAIYQDIVGEAPPKGVYENYQDFYNSTNNNQQQQPSQNEGDLNLNRFVQIAVGLGLDESFVRENPKKAYRILSFKYHPDSTKEIDKNKAIETFKKVTEAFEKLPLEIKNASNWYQRIIF